MLTPVAIFIAGCLIASQARRNMTFSVIALQLFLLVVVVWGAFQLEGRQDELSNTQDDISETQDAVVATQQRLTEERKVRSKVQGEINRYVCNENNRQDRILAGLVQVSVGGQTTFAQGIDESQLSSFDIAVVGSIAKVQRLGATTQQQTAFRSAFEKALRELENETPCKTLVTAFLAASTTDDLKAIRRILRDASLSDSAPDTPPAHKHPQGPAKP